MKALLFSIFFSSSLLTLGQSPDVNLTDFIRETQQWKKSDNRMQLVWWVPTVYWEVSGKTSKQMTAEAIAKIQEKLKDYVLIFVTDFSISNDGSFTYNDSVFLRSNLTLLDSSNTVYHPLEDIDISAQAISVAERLKPMFSQMLGQLGKNLSPFFFKYQNEKGENLIDPNKAATFKFQLDKTQFTWNLPLVSLMPPKFCPIDNAIMKGNWKFCPIHGVKLSN